VGKELGKESERRFDGQTLAREFIDDGQHCDLIPQTWSEIG
jgi:hypothetical protein